MSPGALKAATAQPGGVGLGLTGGSSPWHEGPAGTLEGGRNRGLQRQAHMKTRTPQRTLEGGRNKGLPLAPPSKPAHPHPVPGLAPKGCSTERTPSGQGLARPAIDRLHLQALPEARTTRRHRGRERSRGEAIGGTGARRAVDGPSAPEVQRPTGGSNPARSLRARARARARPVAASGVKAEGRGATGESRPGPKRKGPVMYVCMYVCVFTVCMYISEH
jgi:hypothetical protein